MEKRALAVLPLLDATETVIKARGLRLTPISTIRLIRKVYREVTQENPKGNANRLIRLAVRKGQNLRLLSDSYNS